MTKAPDFPEGTKVIIKDRRNVDGTWTETERYMLFPNGSRRDLLIADCNSGQPKSNAGLSSAS